MNTLKVEAKLAEKYKYKPLEKDLSEKYRNYYIENIPDFLNINGDKASLRTSYGTIVCDGYERIVVGDYGAFVEFNGKQANSKLFKIKQGQEYRIHDPKYSKNVKYEWFTINDKNDIKIYKQKKAVLYADYKPKMYYVNVHEVIVSKVLDFYNI